VDTQHRVRSLGAKATSSCHSVSLDMRSSRRLPVRLTPLSLRLFVACQLPDLVHETHDWRGRTQWLAHHNAIFDCCWMDNDTRLATCSGDQRCRLWDVNTQQLVVTLRGHTGSVKTCAARTDAPWSLATGARDGTLCLWDTRLPARSSSTGTGPALLPVSRISVRRAHCSACSFAPDLALSARPPSVRFRH